MKRIAHWKVLIGWRECRGPLSILAMSCSKAQNELTVGSF